MSDPRRLSTEEIINSGILSRRVPDSALPAGRDWIEVHWDYEYIGDDAALAALRDESKAISSSNEDGIPHLWKESDNLWHGVLLQYRLVSEDRTFDNEEEAFQWFREKCTETAG